MCGSKPATCYSQGTRNSVSQRRWMPCEETINSNMKQLNGASDWKVSADLNTSLQFPVYIIQTEKWPEIVAWSDSKKSVLLTELTVPEKKKPIGGRRTEEKQIRDIACRLHGKGFGYVIWSQLRLSVVVF